MGQAMHVEHIDPTGGNHPDNLCLACPNCNLSKAAATSAKDPDTGEHVPLFNPRSQEWDEHFEWQDNNALIQGLTTIGRTIVTRFKINRPRIVLARKRWMLADLHPVLKDER